MVDASVALKWLVVEEDAARAVELLQSGSDFFAPRLIIDEVANALWKKTRRQLLKPSEAMERIRLLPRYFKALLDISSMDVVLDMAMTIDHPIYDCIYLQAARERGLPFITADSSFSNKASMIPGINICKLSQWTSIAPP